MDRCAMFVDAGYLLAAGGALCCASRRRAEVVCNYPELVRALIGHARGHCGLELLRVYWYDGAPDAVPLADHLAIGELPNVKLRLGRLSGNKQKGVDSLIMRDVMTLARERAVATAYLLGGDEDLREGVVAAQDMGMRVVVIGIPPHGQLHNQARTLIREADEHMVLPREVWAPHFARHETPAPQPLVEPAAPVVEPGVPPRPATPSPEELGKAFAAEWVAKATEDEKRELLGQAPRIPVALDAQLIRIAQGALGSISAEDREPIRRRLRAAFWAALRAA